MDLAYLGVGSLFFLLSIACVLRVFPERRT